MIELLPAKCRDEILCCGGSVWAGVLMNHHKTLAKHATLLIPDRAMQFLKCVTIDTCIDCGALKQEVQKQNAFSVPKHCAHVLPSWNGLLEFRLCWRWSVPPLHGLLFRFRGCVQHPCLIPCECTAQEVIAFLITSFQKVQRTGLPFQFVFFCKHLKHPARTQFPKLKFIRYNFMKKWPWNLRKMQGKSHSGESSVLSNLLYNCKHQIFIHLRWSAASRIIMHTFVSFTKQSHPSPYQWITHGMFSIHITKLMMNFSRFHVLHIQETDYRSHFTCSWILYFLKHYKHTAGCVNTVRMSANCIRALPHNQQTRHTCTSSWPQHCNGNIRKWNLFSG